METGKIYKALAYEVLCGDWGIGAERKRRLIQAGYNMDDYKIIQALVNEYYRIKKEKSR